MEPHAANLQVYRASYSLPRLNLSLSQLLRRGVRRKKRKGRKERNKNQMILLFKLNWVRVGTINSRLALAKVLLTYRVTPHSMTG